ncbi:hypothetical protein D3C80_1707050 [compost metagenome]
MSILCAGIRNMGVGRKLLCQDRNRLCACLLTHCVTRPLTKRNSALQIRKSKGINTIPTVGCSNQRIEYFIL